MKVSTGRSRTASPPSGSASARLAGRHRRSGAGQFLQQQHVDADLRRHARRVPLLPVQRAPAEHRDLHGRQQRACGHWLKVQVQYTGVTTGTARTLRQRRDAAGLGPHRQLQPHEQPADRPALERRAHQQRLRRLLRRDRDAARSPASGRADERDRHGARQRCRQLDWTAPANDGGSTITGYKITPNTSTASQRASLLTGSSATTFRFGGLTNGTTYTFTVAAVNAAGAGARSAPGTPVTPAPAPPPGPPPGSSRTAGDARPSLTWIAARVRRRQPDHELPGHAVHRRQPADADRHRVDRDQPHGDRPHERHDVHVHRRRRPTRPARAPSRSRRLP